MRDRKEAIKARMEEAKRLLEEEEQAKAAREDHRIACVRESAAKRNEDLELRELASRALARRRLLAYIQKMDPKYTAGWVHKDVCARIERFVQDVHEGKQPRLMLTMPPRHGKSRIASKEAPEWILGQYPDWEIINASYAISLPLGFSRAVRETLRSPEYAAIFPETALDPNNQNAEGWKTTKGGGFLPAGVGGGITGKGAHILIIDDPFKDAEEADSQTMRDKVHDWYSSTAYTRLAPNSGVLIINTRWHDDDLSGRQLSMQKEAERQAQEAREGGDDELAEQILSEVDRWEIVDYPAIATHAEHITPEGRVFDNPHPELHTICVRNKGEALHEARFPLKRLLKIKRTLQPRHWAALYQQNPVPDDGLIFRKEYFKYYQGRFPWEVFPVFSTWDLAIGQKQHNDFTVGIAAALDYEGRLNVLEMVRGRLDSYEIVEAMLNMYLRYHRAFGGYQMGIEEGQLKLAIGPILKRRMKERSIYPAMAQEGLLRPITDKVARARPLQGLMQQGMVVFPQDTAQTEIITAELLRFPGGVHDDCVDTLAWMARMVQNIPAPKPPKKKQLKSWRDNLGKYITGYGDKNFMAA